MRLPPRGPVDEHGTGGDGALHLRPGNPEVGRHHRVQAAGPGLECLAHGSAPDPVAAGPEASDGSASSSARSKLATARIAAPSTIAVSAKLKIGQTCRSMKSVTRPLNPGPFATRSARFPRAPPRIRPSDTAIHGRIGRVETTTITTETTIVAL